MTKDTMICKCGHSKYEHNAPDPREDEDPSDTFCSYEQCSCNKYDPIEIEQAKIIGGEGT